MEVEIDDELGNRLSNRADQHGFSSTEEYINTILEVVVDELEDGSNDGHVRDRLEDLGYL